MPSLRILRTFLAVAAEGSFTAAAHRVALTQAAVGLQMRSLENDLQRELFTRNGKLVTLNGQGRALIPVAQQIVSLYSQARAGTQADEPLVGTAQFGSIISSLGQMVHATLALKRRHPAVNLHLVSGKSNALIAQVENRKIDAAIVVRNPVHSNPAMEWIPLYSEPMVLLAPASARPCAPAEMVARYPFIRFDRSENTGELVERILRKLRAKPQEFLELNSIEGIVELVKDGLGVSLLPKLAGRPWSIEAGLRTMSVNSASEQREIALVQLRDSPRAKVVEAIAQEMKLALKEARQSETDTAKMRNPKA